MGDFVPGDFVMGVFVPGDFVVDSQYSAPNLAQGTNTIPPAPAFLKNILYTPFKPPGNLALPSFKEPTRSNRKKKDRDILIFPLYLSSRARDLFTLKL